MGDALNDQFRRKVCHLLASRFENWVTTHNSSKKRTADMGHTTGFSRDQITDLCQLVHV